MPINRYSTNAVSQFNPLSMQELSFAPTMLRQRHDQSVADLQSIDTSTFQFLPQDREFAEELSSGLQGNIDEVINQINTKGYSPDAFGKVIGLKRDRQNLFSQQGDVGRVQHQFEEFGRYRDNLDKLLNSNKISGDKHSALLNESLNRFQTQGGSREGASFTGLSAQADTDPIKLAEDLTNRIINNKKVITDITGLQEVQNPDGSTHYIKVGQKHERSSPKEAIEQAIKTSLGNNIEVVNDLLQRSMLGLLPGDNIEEYINSIASNTAEAFRIDKVTQTQDIATDSDLPDDDNLNDLIVNRGATRNLRNIKSVSNFKSQVRKLDRSANPSDKRRAIEIKSQFNLAQDLFNRGPGKELKEQAALELKSELGDTLTLNDTQISIDDLIEGKDYEIDQEFPKDYILEDNGIILYKDEKGVERSMSIFDLKKTLKDKDGNTIGNLEDLRDSSGNRVNIKKIVNFSNDLDDEFNKYLKSDEIGESKTIELPLNIKPLQRNQINQVVQGMNDKNVNLVAAYEADGSPISLDTEKARNIMRTINQSKNVRFSRIIDSPIGELPVLELAFENADGDQNTAHIELKDLGANPAFKNSITSLFSALSEGNPKNKILIDQVIDDMVYSDLTVTYGDDLNFPLDKELLSDYGISLSSNITNVNLKYDESGQGLNAFRTVNGKSKPISVGEYMEFLSYSKTNQSKSVIQNLQNQINSGKLLSSQNMPFNNKGEALKMIDALDG